MTPKRSALIRRRRRRFASASDAADVGNNSSVSESGSTISSISSPSEDNSDSDDSEERTDGADLDISRPLESEATTSSSQQPTTVDPPATSQVLQGQDGKSVARVNIPVTPATKSSPRFNSSNGWDRFPDVVDRNGQVDHVKIASSKPKTIHYLNARQIIEPGEQDGMQNPRRDVYGGSDSRERYKNGFRPQSMPTPRSGARYDSAISIRPHRWWSRQYQSPNYSDIVTLLLQSPLYVKIPGDATSKIIKGYHRRLHSFSPDPSLARRPMRIFLPEMKAKIVYPSPVVDNPKQSVPTEEATIKSAYAAAYSDSEVSQSHQFVIESVTKPERPSTSTFIRNKYTDVRLEHGQQFQQRSSVPDGESQSSVDGREDTSRQVEACTTQPLALSSSPALGTSTDTDKAELSSQANSVSYTPPTGPRAVFNPAQRQNRPPSFMSQDVRFRRQDPRLLSRSPHGGRQFGTPRENVEYSNRPGADVSEIPNKNDSEESENVPPPKKTLPSEAAVNSALFEDDELSAVPKVRLPPASVYTPSPTEEVVAESKSKSPDLPVAVESESAPPTVVSQHIVAPMRPSPAPAPLPPQSAEPAGVPPVAVLPSVPMIPKEYRLTPEVMHQPRPTKVVSVADIEPPVPQQSPVDGQQQRYTYAPRPRGFSNGYRGPRQDSSHSHGSHMPQYYYPVQTQDGKGMMRNIVPRAYTQGYVSSMEGMSPVAYPPVVMPNGAILPVAAPSPQPVVTSVPSSTIAQETNGMVYFYDPIQYYQYYTENTTTPPQVPPVVMPVVAPTAQPLEGGIYYYPHVPQSTAYYQH
ncbi:hypothetical protein V1523DRAFT_400325 [Lipomyces doorenjongii]